MPLDLLTRLDPLKRLRCPFCFERFPAFELHFRCDEPACKADYARMIDDPILSKALHGRHAGRGALRSPWWVDPRADDRRGARRHLDWMILPGALDCPHCGKPTDYHLCPRCHAHLPESAITLDAGHIAIFGPQSVGKTTFITVLIHELDHRVGPKHGFILEPLTPEIGQRYEHEYHDVTYGVPGLGVADGPDAATFRHSHGATPSLQTHRGVLHPLVYRLTRRKGGRRASTLLSFFDTAGEDWEMNVDLLRSEARYLGLARGLLFLLDPMRLPEVARAPGLELTPKERHVPPADYLADARKLATFFRKVPVKTPLAIVLNKLDRWGHLFGPETTIGQVARSPVPPEADPALDSAIHEEVQAALRHWGATAFLEHVATNFPDHRFFACSALGDAAQDRDDAPQPLPTPLLIERPVLWLLGRQGIVR